VLVGYWVLVRWVPVPGAGMPVRDVPFLDKDLNIVAWLDRQLMPNHLYEDFMTHNVRDPEGLLSDIPALGTALLGLLAGVWLRSQREVKTRALGLAAGAAACLASGYLWSIWFPLNKKMWTSSYVLVAAGWSLTIFALVFWAVEIKGWGKAGGSSKGGVLARAAAWPWLVFGSNAIAAYMFSELLGGVVDLLPFTADGQKTDALTWMHTQIFNLISNPGWAAFGYSFSFMAICFLPVWFLYWKKIFLKV
jgi:predicted acyltransferase